MGNEASKESFQVNGKVPEKHENGGVNGISLTITANGHTLDIPTKIPTEKVLDSLLPEENMTDSTENVPLESQSGPPEAEVQPLDLSVHSEDVQNDKEPDTSDPSDHSEDVQSQGSGKVSLFSKMFKKKSATEKVENNEDQTDMKPEDHTQQLLQNGDIHKEHMNVEEAPPAPEEKSDSTEHEPLESQSGTPEAEPPNPSVHSKEDQPKEEKAKEKVSLFNKMFKKKSAPATVKVESNEDQTDMKPEDHPQPQQNGDIHKEHMNVEEAPPAPEEKSDSTEPEPLESQSGPPEAEPPNPSVHSEEDQPKEEKVSLFSKMFKKKSAPATEKEAEEEKDQERQTEETSEDKTDSSSAAADQQLETEALTAETEPRDEVEEGESDPEPKGDESEQGTLGENEDSDADDNPVMNFFKTLVTPTKTKKEAPVPDATKEQPQASETQPAPAATTTVAQVLDPPAPPKGMPAPPPPPPEPPRAEPAAKAVKPKEEAKPKDSPQARAKGTLTRLFKSKKNPEKPHAAVEEPPTAEVQVKVESALPVSEQHQTDGKVETQDTAEVQPESVVEEQKPDASKASTLEAAAKPEPAPAAPEEKKPEAKKSLLSFFKPKALLDRVSATVQAASTSGVELFRKTTGAAAEPKATPAPAAASAAEPGPAKEEPPKVAKSPEAAAAESKPAAAAPPGGEEAASAAKKMEKRNSITLFFKNLSQKRPSTDAGAPTEAEKTK